MGDLGIYDGCISKLGKGARWLIGRREKQKGMSGIMKCVLLDCFCLGRRFNNSMERKDGGVSMGYGCGGLVDYDSSLLCWLFENNYLFIGSDKL